MNDFLEIVKVIIGTGIVGTCIILVIKLLVYIAKNPDIVLKWSEVYYKYIGFHEKNRQKKIVSSELDYRITRIANIMNKESDGILPFGLKIKWIKDDKNNNTAAVANDQIILVLKETPDTDKNIVDACMLFTPKAFLPKVRHSCDQNILHHLDMYTIKKMLSLGRYTSAYNYFMQQIINCGIADGTINKDDIDTLQLGDEKGLYSRILLNELRLLGDCVFATIEEAKYNNDTIEFYNFMKAIINRRPGENTRLLFIGLKIKVGIIFVAKKSTLESYYGLDSYIHRVDLDFQNGAERVYMMGYKMYQEECEVDIDGYVINVVKHASFEYLEEIERKLTEGNKYSISISEKYPIIIEGKEKYVKLITIEKRGI